MLASDVLAGFFGMCLQPEIKDVLAMGKKRRTTCLQTTWDMRHVLASARVAKGLSMNELARRAGISPSQVYHLETGSRMPRPETLDAICHALGVNLAVVET